MYYPCSENKGADQLCSYLCFRIGKNLVFSSHGSFIFHFSQLFSVSFLYKMSHQTAHTAYLNIHILNKIDNITKPPKN